MAFIALVVALLALDLGILNRKPHAPSMREASGWTVLWVSIGLAFSGVIWLLYDRGLFGVPPPDPALSGAEAALLYLTAFVLEKSLSIDNLFVMAMIFGSYRIPVHLQHRVLFWGILGALVMRAAMILGGVWLIARFSWLMYLFGGYLLWAGISQLREEPPEEGTSPLFARILSRFMPVHESLEDGHFLRRVDGTLYATPMLLAVVSIEAADVVFALDSVPAVLTISTDSFIVFTSNVFAILGLRALYFVLADMMERFARLKYALAFLLAFIGAKMILHEWVHIPIGLSLVIVLGSLLAGVLASIYGPQPKAGSDTPEESAA